MKDTIEREAVVEDTVKDLVRNVEAETVRFSSVQASLVIAHPVPLRTC